MYLPTCPPPLQRKVACWKEGEEEEGEEVDTEIL